MWRWLLVYREWAAAIRWRRLKSALLEVNYPSAIIVANLE